MTKNQVVSALQIAGNIDGLVKSKGLSQSTLVGDTLMGLAPSLVLIPPPAGLVSAAVVGAVGFAINVFKKQFGKNFQNSYGVRQLQQIFEYYVVGDVRVSDADKVNEARLPLAYSWFQAAFGVPIYDFHRLNALAGFSKNWKPLNNSVAARVTNYLNFEDPQTVGISLTAAGKAVEIAKSVRYEDPPGSWKDWPVAEHWLLPEVLKPLELSQPASANPNLLQQSDIKSIVGDVSSYLKNIGYIPILVVLFVILLLTGSKR